MHRGNVVITASAAAAVVLAVLAGVVSGPGPTVTDESDDPTSHGCVAYGDDPRAVVVTVVARVTSGVHLLGARVAGARGTDGDVRVRVVPGYSLESGYSDGDGILDGHRARSPRGVDLPAGRSTFVLTLTRRADVDLSQVDAIDVSSAGPLGTVRSSRVHAGVGLATEEALDSGACQDD